ncbi:penicillin-binding protein [Candidatus Peribacteria bacterium]|nr:MAG: penicillin-binding protein [Candidatus Peribacteria bacterium]
MFPVFFQNTLRTTAIVLSRHEWPAFCVIRVMHLTYRKQWHSLEQKIAEISANVMDLLRHLMSADGFFSLYGTFYESVRPVGIFLVDQISLSINRLRHPVFDVGQSRTFTEELRWLFARKWILIACILLFFGCAVFAAFMMTLPDVHDARLWKAPGSIAVKDRDGGDMYFAYEKEDRVWLQSNEIPDVVKDAFIAIEDERFWSRGCIDWRAIGRAVLANTTDYKSQGASTITQQLVRTALLTPEKKFVRKIKELTLACELETVLSKDEILTHYLNWISFGGVTAGVQQASRHFFGKDVREVTVAEAAVLASLTQRPTYYSPYGSHRYTQLSASGSGMMIGLTGTSALLPGRSGPMILGGRAHQVLANMEEQGYINTALKNDADRELLTLRFQPNVRTMQAPHYVLSMLETLRKKLPAGALHDELSVTTTIDSALQKKAETLAAAHAKRIAEKYNAHNIAMIVADTHTQEILAYVGNVDFFGSASGSKIDMVTVPRQPGSSFKPIVYAATMQHAGWGPTTIVADTPLTIGGQSPRNYAGDFEGKIPLIQALNHSRNIPAIRAFSAVGEDRILNFAARIGAATPLSTRTELTKDGQAFDYNWPLAIGAAEVPLLEMVQAYSTFANSGVYRPLTGVRAVKDASGNSYLPESRSGSEVIPSSVADAITAMLSEASSRPEGFWRTVTNVPGIDEAVKTGTSNVCLERSKTACKKMLPRDVWSIGYTPQFIVGVWMGNVDGSPLTANADGLNAAVPLWREMLVAAHDSPMAKDSLRAFTGTRAPYYAQHPTAKPKPVVVSLEEPTWMKRGNRAILSRRN